MTDRPLVLLFNEVWFEGRWVRLMQHPACDLTDDRSRLAEADIVAFHMPQLRLEDTPLKYPGQFWLGCSMESDVYYPKQADPRFLRHFDLVACVRQDCDLWMPYIPPRIVEHLRTQPKSKSEGIVYMQSNDQDRAGRRDFVGVLMSYTNVNSYGESLRNQTRLPRDAQDEKLAVFAKHAFTLAFENSIQEDYVTEKFFEPLTVGSVPVYRGAPNIEEFAPGGDCFIDVRRFDGPRALAEYLDHLCNTPEEYQHYLDWRDKPLRPQFLEKVELIQDDMLTRLAARWRTDAQGRTRTGKPYYPAWQARYRRVLPIIRHMQRLLPRRAR